VQNVFKAIEWPGELCALSSAQPLVTDADGSRVKRSSASVILSVSLSIVMYWMSRCHTLQKRLITNILIEKIRVLAQP